MSDYYDLLSLDPQATPEQIHHAYRMLALRIHPDRNPIPGAERTMAAVNEAYSVLSDPARRRAYDHGRIAGERLDVALPILAAARSLLMKQGWKAREERRGDLILERPPLRALVRLVPEFGACELGEWIDASARAFRRRNVGLSVALAARVLVIPEKIPAAVAVLSGPAIVMDLVRSRRFGSAFPGPGYRALFVPFCRD